MIDETKNKIIEIGKLLWDKGLVFGFNGNLSARISDQTVYITATGVCLGYLTLSDILTINLNGEVLGQGKASTECLMHTEIYKNLPKIKCVLHTHSTYTNGYFLSNDVFTPKTFEAQFYLGTVKAIAQSTPSVTETKPVIDALQTNNIVVLKNHGVVAVGTDLFQAFVLVQELEEQVKMDLVNIHYQQTLPTRGHVQKEQQNVSPSSLPTSQPLNVKAPQGNPQPPSKKYKLFSKEQIEEIVKLVNGDAQMQELGLKTAMNMDLAVCLQETGELHSFKFTNGRIVETGKNSKAEFLITADEKIWRAVFNQEIDPFVATTQKKMTLQGDFARISKWYAPCSRIFQLWTQVPIE